MAKPDEFHHASKLLSMNSFPPGFEKNAGARKEFDKLWVAVEKIQSVLLDAEMKQEGNPDVKDWIEKVKDELNGAEALFAQERTSNPLMEVFSYPFAPNDSFSKKVKAIRKRLLQLYEDVDRFKFVKCHFEHPKIGFRAGETHGFIDPRDVLGREDDKKIILQLLFDESESVDQDSVSVIAIANIEGMGKTTLAQLVYNDNEVQKKFKNKWWAHISSTSDEKQVLGKIFQSISEKTRYQQYNISQLESKIRDSLSRCTEKYLLVLDDVWDNNLAMWSKIMSLLSTSTKGGKVIVTTRFLSVARAMQKGKCHVYQLNGLSDENSWELFKMIALTEEQKHNPTWTNVGREITSKCSNVPLTIYNIASLLRSGATEGDLQYWEEIAKNGKSLLKLSYDHLTPNLKRCFAYCSLLPRDHIILKERMIYLWIAQKIVKLGKYETLEAAGHAYFMELFHIGFFREAKVDDNGDIISCKMHDIIYDDIKRDYVVHDEDGMKVITMPTARGPNQFPKKIRHASFRYEKDDNDNSMNVPQSLLEQAKGLRSLIIVFGKPCSSLDHLERVTVLKSLRAFDLHASNIEEVPSSIDKLIRLRYLNLSENTFQKLPDSITMLIKLLTLDVSCCRHLEALPDDFRKLTKLRHLDISFCDNLWHMPPGFGELTSLVHLSDFKVSKRSGSDSKNSGLDALERLNLRGKLTITYDYKGVWRRDEKMLKSNHIPTTVGVLTISDNPSSELPSWWKEIDNVVMSNLQHLVLIRCKRLRRLPALYRLPELRILQLYHLQELECIVEIEADVSTKGFFGSLERIEMVDLPKLGRWMRLLKEERTQYVIATEEYVKNVEHPPLDHLSHLEIKSCHRLESMPPPPCLQRLCLEETRKELVQQLVSTCFVSSPSSNTPSSILKDITINWCIELSSFPGEGLTNLRKLEIRNCTSLKELQLTPNALKEITISNCPNVQLWGRDWSSFTKLNLLNLDEIPEEKTLPDSFQLLGSLGKPHINKW